ncbi:MAG: D-2-hydroxyacid dehydrogenase [Cyclobacteriaceae bacterium]
MNYTILIASYLEPEHIERIKRAAPQCEVIYEPELIAAPRYAADHKGEPIKRTPEQEQRWLSFLKRTDILFDFDQTHLKDLPELAPNVKWMQATSSGIGQALHKLQYAERMPNTVFTSARGVHDQPLAEFCLMVMMAFNKKLIHTLESQKKKHWERFAGTDLRGKTIGIIGMGKVGQRVGQLCQCFGMKVVGVKRDTKGIEPASVFAEELYNQSELEKMLPRAEYLVLIAPHTPETENMIGEKELMLLPKGAILINIGRGALIDEPALIHALQSGHLGGAGLDVFAVEPLPNNSPLWEMPNVIVSPHSGSTSDRENELITDVFCDNLKNYLEGKPLINVIDTKKMF